MTGVSPLHSDEGRRLLDIIDKLKLLPSISHEIALPQIVVVGQQSSGKSSVLKAISNVDFPTNSGFCTQFATEIICRREQHETIKAQVIPHDVVGDDYLKRLEAFSQRWNHITLNTNVADIIKDAKVVMGLNSHRRISKDKLRLEFSGPTQDHISLIDLPGLFDQELPGQRENDKALVDEIVKDYISGSHTIILAVVSGAYDLQVQRIFRMFEPYQDRTLGIVTAPDLIESGTVRASTFKKLVSNSSFKAGHGWHILRNLSHREEQEGKDRDEVEAQFIVERAASQENIWAALPEDRFGMKNLKYSLACLLQKSISEGLPHIQRQLRSAQNICEFELNLLGNERGTPEQQRDYLAEKSELLRELTMKELRGGRNQRSLRSRIRNANDRFADEMVTKGAYWEFVSAGAKDIEAVEQYDENAPVKITDKEWIISMLEEISNSRGQELDGLVDPVWVGRMFLRQSRKWKTIADCHIDEAYSTVEQFFNEIMQQVVGKENVDRFLLHVIQPELRRRNQVLKRKLLELLSPYRTENIRTLNRRFRNQQKDLSSVLSEDSGKRGLMQNMIAHYTSIMIEYYDLAMSTFIDNVESLAIENVLLDGLQDIMTGAKAYKMSDDDVRALASETDDIVEKRRTLTTRMHDYREGSRIVSRYSLGLGLGASSLGNQPSSTTPPRHLDPTPMTPSITVTASGAGIAPISTLAAQSSSADCSIDTLIDIDSPSQRHHRRPSNPSTRSSSIASRIFSEAEDELSSREPTPATTPSKSKVGQPNRVQVPK